MTVKDFKNNKKISNYGLDFSVCFYTIMSNYKWPSFPEFDAIIFLTRSSRQFENEIRDFESRLVFRSRMNCHQERDECLEIAFEIS